MNRARERWWKSLLRLRRSTNELVEPDWNGGAAARQSALWSRSRAERPASTSRAEFAPKPKFFEDLKN